MMIIFSIVLLVLPCLDVLVATMNKALLRSLLRSRYSRPLNYLNLAQEAFESAGRDDAVEYVLYIWREQEPGVGPGSNPKGLFAYQN